jgi:hypothetical protein
MSRPVTNVHCPAKKWTEVTWVGPESWLTFFFTPTAAHYRITPATHSNVNWRWISAGIPPYWGGWFDGGEVVITFPPVAAYTSIQFYPNDHDIDVAVIPGNQNEQQMP